MLHKWVIQFLQLTVLRTHCLHLNLIVSPVKSTNMLATLAQDGKYSLSSMSPFCLPSKRETVEGDQGSISGHHLKLGSQTFYDCWAKWIWDRGNSTYLSSRQPHFLAPCAPLTGRLVRRFLFFKEKTGAPTLPGSNRLDFPRCNVVSDTPFLL